MTISKLTLRALALIGNKDAPDTGAEEIPDEQLGRRLAECWRGAVTGPTSQQAIWEAPTYQLRHYANLAQYPDGLSASSLASIRSFLTTLRAADPTGVLEAHLLKPTYDHQQAKVVCAAITEAIARLGLENPEATLVGSYPECGELESLKEALLLGNAAEAKDALTRVFHASTIFDEAAARADSWLGEVHKALARDPNPWASMSAVQEAVGQIASAVATHRYKETLKFPDLSPGAQRALELLVRHSTWLQCGQAWGELEPMFEVALERDPTKDLARLKRLESARLHEEVNLCLVDHEIDADRNTALTKINEILIGSPSALDGAVHEKIALILMNEVGEAGHLSAQVLARWPWVIRLYDFDSGNLRANAERGARSW